MDIFRYDFGYDWPWTTGHAIVFVIFALLTLVAWRRRWPLWATALCGALGIWAAAGALLMSQMSLPMTLPTEAFLRGGEGRVLDMGAGSGRSTLMVLQGRPRATVTALDRYTGYYGIVDNTPDRLRANARVAGAVDRLQVQVGDMREMPFDAASFDGAVSAYAIDHLRASDVPRALSEAARVLRPGAEFLLVIVNVDVWARLAVPWAAMHGHGYFGREQQAERWTGLLKTAGFEMVEHGTMPMSQYFLSRKSGVESQMSERGHGAAAHGR
jgi:SAM-dependent methyltransferase